jgi:hypothetical protein
MTRVSVTVQASATHPGVLDVKDAMQQVLDFFDMLSADEDKASVVWNLVFAGTNSPFRAEAEAVSLHPDVDVTAIAKTRLRETSDFLDDVSQGKAPRRRLGKKRTDAARKLLRRNTVGIGLTTARFEGLQRDPIRVTPKIAEIAVAAIDADVADKFDLLPAKRARIEIGSVEGTLIDVGTDYSFPAIHIREHKSGDNVTCRIDLGFAEEIAQSATFKDVWEHRRVIVRGRIHYNEEGEILRVHARTVRRVAPRDMTLRDIEDPDFTGDLGTSEYIKRLREGDLG